MRMLFVTNHDKNAWEGTQYEIFGEAVEAVIALSVTSEGMPLIYNGQEAGEGKRLSFFEKDPIEWQEHPHWRALQKTVCPQKEKHRPVECSLGRKDDASPKQRAIKSIQLCAPE